MSADEAARNKQIVEEFIREVPLGGNLDALDRLVAEDYIQHNPHAGQGREGVRRFFAEAEELHAALHPDGIREVNLVAEGEFVVRQELRDNGMLVDVWRVRDGLLREHWDAWRPAEGHERIPGF